MTKKRNPIINAVIEFLHRLTTKISLVFEGKKAVFKIEIDLTKDVRPQIHGLEYAMIDAIKKNELQTPKTA